MSSAARTWLLIVLSIGYLAGAHFALATRSSSFAAMAVALLLLLTLVSLRGRHRKRWRIAIGTVGAAVVVLIARGAPPVPLLVPSVAIPAAIAWMFGRTLLPGRIPLIERLARALHAPTVPPPEVIEYTRRVTWAWVLLLGTVALVNATLILNLVPGGLLALAGYDSRWPVSPAAFAWFSSTGTYLFIGGMFAIEFAVRIWRFPGYRFRNPVHFIREARSRMPSIMAAVRHD